jgi:hypothetical protein
VFDFVGQFIHIVRPARKIFRQELPGCSDALDQAGGEVGMFEMVRHFLRKLSPEFVTTPFVNTYITDNREFMRKRGDENQDRITFAGTGHAHAKKVLLGDCDRRFNVFAADEDADFTRSFQLGLPDCRDYFFVVQLIKEIFGFHMTTNDFVNHSLPTATRPAASKAPAAARESATSTAASPSSTSAPSTTATPTATPASSTDGPTTP